MRPTLAVAVVAAVLAGGVVLPAAATVGAFGADAVGGSTGPDLDAGVTDDPTPPAEVNAAESTVDDGNVSPGERLSGVVGIQGAELDAEVTERRFERRVAAAADDRGRATVVAETVVGLRDRLDRLTTERQRLREALRNGSITPGEYRARVATLAASVAGTQRLLNDTATTAAALPAETLNDTGVDPAAINDLRRNASELTGEVADTARDIGGPDTGKPVGPPGDRGPPDGVPSESDNRTDSPGGSGPPDDGASGDGDERGPPDDPDTPGGNETDPGNTPGDGADDGDGSDGRNAGGNGSSGDDPDGSPGVDSGGDDGRDGRPGAGGGA